MKMKIKVVRREKNYDKTKKSIRRQITEIVTYGLNATRNTAVIGIAQGVKSGKVRPDVSRASAEGEFPATDTGFLVSQITTNTFVIGASVIGQIVSAAPYSKWLEFGHPARDGSFVEARPFMQPALEQNKKKIKEIFIREGILKR